MRACARPAASTSPAVAGPSPKCDVRTFPEARECRVRAPRRPHRGPRPPPPRARARVRAASTDQDDAALAPRVFDAVEDIRARSSSAAEETAALDAARNAVLESTEALDPTLAPFEALEHAASFVGWRVVRLADGAEVGEVRHALAMAGGEVVAQVGDAVDEHDEHSAGDTSSPRRMTATIRGRGGIGRRRLRWRLGGDLKTRGETTRAFESALDEPYEDEPYEDEPANAADAPPFRWCSAFAAARRARAGR